VKKGNITCGQKENLKKLLGDDAELIADYYGVGQEGLAENGKSILLKTSGIEAFAEQNNLNPGYFKQKLDYANSKLLEERNKRIKPGLDDKILLGWNALAIKGLQMLIPRLKIKNSCNWPKMLTIIFGKFY
jgi:uncharacterized protein YyaL (SSP411 family)